MNHKECIDSPCWSPQYNVEVWDDIGALVDQVIIESEPVMLAMAGNVVAIASHYDLYVWHFHDAEQRIEAQGKTLQKK